MKDHTQKHKNDAGDPCVFEFGVLLAILALGVVLTLVAIGTQVQALSDYPTTATSTP